MRYGVLDGGKRLRPLLVMAAADSGRAAQPEAALRASCAVELIHAYSLVHDDMPCMDNDVLRRGKPTVHVQLRRGAGDAGGRCDAGAGLRGADAGQTASRRRCRRGCAVCWRARPGTPAWPAARRSTWPASASRSTKPTLRDMHHRKTGALLQASVLMGAACGDPSAPACDALGRYGTAIGLAFQVVDDVLDVTQASDTLGKTAGKDVERNKPTYVSVLGLDAAMRHALELRDQALVGAGCQRAGRTPAGSSDWPTRSLRETVDDELHVARDHRQPGRRASARPPPAPAAGDRAAQLPAAQHRADRRPPVVEPRHGRADGRAAPCLQHAARPAGLGRGPPDLSAQDPDRPARPHGHAAPARWHQRLSASRGKRVRHFRHRAFVAPRSRPRSAWRWPPS